MSQAKLKKASEVKELADKFTRAKGIVFTSFSGLNVEDTTDFRKKVSKAGLEYKVIKNNIINRALREIKLDSLEKFINGPTGVVISFEDPVLTAKIVKEFSSSHDKLQVRAGVIEGKSFDSAEIKVIADLPPKEILLAKVVGGMKAPFYKLVYVLNANMQKLVGTLEAVRKNKEKETK